MQTFYKLINSQGFFMNGMSLFEVSNFIESTTQVCPECLIRKKDHYCIQSSCKNRQLICSNCHIQNIQSIHFLHDHTYVLPLFSNYVFDNFYKMKDNFTRFHKNLQSQIKLFQDHIQRLNNILQSSVSFLNQLVSEERQMKYKEYKEQMKAFIVSPKGKPLSSILHDFHFQLPTHYFRMEEDKKKELLNSVELLQFKDSIQFLKKSLNFNNEKQNILISAFSPINISGINTAFRQNYQYYSSKLRNRSVHIKIGPTMLSNLNEYEACIYNFQNCRKIIIQNATIDGLRILVTLPHLKDLQLTMVDAQPRGLGAANQITSFKSSITSLCIKSLILSDIDYIKQFTKQCPKLQKLQLQFKDYYNSISWGATSSDSLYKLAQYLKTEGSKKKLSYFVCKIQTNDSSHQLRGAIMMLVRQNIHLIRFSLDGIQSIEADKILELLATMPYLMQYRIYANNQDCIASLPPENINNIVQTVKLRRHIFNGLARATKMKYLPEPILEALFKKYLIG